LIQLNQTELELAEKARLLALWAKRPDIFFKAMTGLEPSPKQREVLEACTDLKNTRLVISAARGTGKTILLAVIALWSALILSLKLKEPYKVSILSGSLEQSKVLYTFITEFYQNPVIASFILGEAKVTETKFKTGSWIVALPASEKTILSRHCSLLIIDEAGVEGLEDGVLIQKSMPLISTSKHPRLILASTPYDYFSYHTEVFMNQTKYPEYLRWNWGWSDAPWINLQEAEKAKKELSPEMFRIHWEGIPTALSGAFIPLSDLKACTENPIEPGEGRQAGIDWGLVADPTVCVIVSGGERQVIVSMQTFRDPDPNTLQAKLADYLRLYNVVLVNADSSHHGENMRLMQAGFRVKEVIFKNEKPRMQQTLRAAIANHRLYIPETLSEYQTLIDELRVYTQDTHTNDHHVDALMLSLYGRPLSEAKIEIIAGRKDSTEVLKTEGTSSKDKEGYPSILVGKR
jgi:hypothetical protein